MGRRKKKRVPGKQHRTQPLSSPKKKTKTQHIDPTLLGIAQNQVGQKAIDDLVAMGYGDIVTHEGVTKLRLNDKGLQWSRRLEALRGKEERYNNQPGQRRDRYRAHKQRDRSL